MLSSPTRDVPTPVGTTKSEAFIPSEGPAYETPLDLRYPLHWDEHAHFQEIEDLPARIEEAFEAAKFEIGDGDGVIVRMGVASKMLHYSGTSPLYIRVDVRHKTSHERFSRTILEQFAHLEVQQRPVIRFVLMADYEYDTPNVWD